MPGRTGFFKMKYIVLLCDGMADTPCSALDGLTPMEKAYKPAMDGLVSRSELGTVRTVPEGLAPGSDVANLAVLGYDTRECYTGRSPLEAANIGVELTDTDVAFRCNLVTLSEEPDFAAKTILDYCAGDIHTQDARQIIEAVQAAFGGGAFDFYTGTAYRHCMVWHNGKEPAGLTPPHDITGRVVGPYLPQDAAAAPLLSMMEQSYILLNDHPLNRERIAQGLPPANAIWLWGQGKRPRLQNFRERFGLEGAMISAVDLLKGIGRLAGMEVCDVPGATGYIDTNYEGKRQAALDALAAGKDFVYIHVEAPDECGHRGEPENKVKAVEDIDRRILAPLLAELAQRGEDFTLLILPDHPTPLAIRTHDAAPVPYLLYRSSRPATGKADRFTEMAAKAAGNHIETGYTLLNHMLAD